MTSRTGQNPRVAQEADQLERMIDSTPLTAAQRDQCWDVWTEKGLPAALGTLGAFKAAYKASMPDNVVDQAVERLRIAATERAKTAGDAEIANVIDALAAQLAPKVGGRVTVSDSGRQSVMPRATKAVKLDPLQEFFAHGDLDPNFH